MSDPEWASRVPDHVHQLDLCPGCDGLRVTTLDRLPGVVDVTLHVEDGTPSLTGAGGGFSFRGPAVVHIGPAPDTCPTPEDQEEAERRV